MKNTSKERGFWINKKNVLEYALKCRNISMFRKNFKGAYKSAIRNNWLDECKKHMIRPVVWNKKWNKEICIKVASQCNSRNEFQKKYGSAYVAACKNKWIEDCCQHMNKLGNLHKRLIYSFEFSNKSVYIGLTLNPQKRKKAHLLDKKSSVFKFIEKTNLIPKFKILSDYVDVNSASILEGKFIEKYRKNGWNILNISKSGSLGKQFKHSKESCLKNAMECNTLREFYKKYKGAYLFAYRNNLLSDCRLIFNNK